MFISVKLLTKYVIIIYALGSVRFGSWFMPTQSRSKVSPKAKFSARLGEKNGWAN